MLNTANLKKIQDEIKTSKIDAFLVNDTVDLSYLLGIDAQAGCWALVTRDDLYILSSEMLYDQLNDILNGPKIIKCKKLIEELKNLIYKKKIKTLGIDTAKMTYDIYDKLKRQIQKVNLKIEKGFVNTLRQIKSISEMQLIGKACEITKRVFNIVKNEVKYGVSEDYISRRIEQLFLSNCAFSAFPPIVASGKNASYPHHISSRKTIDKNDVVIIDLGARFEGYCADFTRPVFVGKVKEISEKIFEVAKQAQQKAIDGIKSGIKASYVDKLARDVIDKAGFGKHFMHGTGHGVGLEIHEYPALNPGSEEKLEANMVVTVEPGIYMHNIAGIRIEDTVIVKDKGCEILT